jgi:hypothetical protein
MPPPSSTKDLLRAIFDDPEHPLVPVFTAWCQTTAFRAFAQTYRDKIRKKLRHARNTEGLDDLRWELEVAQRLLQDRSITLEYEKGGVGVQRGPDFVATYKTHTLLAVEVTRMRPTGREEEHAADKLADIVCNKLGQLLANTPNIVVLGVEGVVWRQFDLALAMKQLALRAEYKDEDFFIRRGFVSAVDFLRQLRRLHGVLLCFHSPTDVSHTPLFWFNPVAKPPLLPELQRRIPRLFT